VIERELGRREGTTRVFLAREAKHARTVAIKVLHPSLSSELDVGRFLREIALTARLQHPGILPLLDSGDTGERPWYATPYLSEETLRDRLTEAGRLAFEAALRIAADIADALDHAHAQGVVHRDLRPEQVLLAGGRAVIANFGLAKALQDAAGPRLTGTGVLVGSPGYMSPEQAMGAGTIDGRSDVYSLGCILYEMLTGRPVHEGPTPQAILAKRTPGGGLALPDETYLPPGAAAVIRRALEPDPGRRYGSAGDLVAALTAPTTFARKSQPKAVWLASFVFLLMLVALILTVAL
jgi:serine/threonine-protein kinase